MKQAQPSITVVDWSDASNPVLLGHAAPDELVSGMAVHGDLLLVAAHDAGLLTYERATGSDLVRIGSVVTDNAWHVAAVDDVGLVADGTAGVTVVDLTDPAAPTAITTLPLQGEAAQLVIDGDRALVALSGAGVALLDVADPAAPALIEIEPSPGSVKSVAYSAQTGAVFASAWNDVRVFDLTNRDDLLLIGREPIARDALRDNRSLAVAAIDDILVSANWDLFSTYRYRPGYGAPDVWLDTDAISDSNLAAGETVTKSVWVQNHGTFDATVSVGAVSSGLTATLDAEILARDEYAELVITWTATEAPFEGTVDIESDDPDQPVQTITVAFNQPGLGVGSQPPNYEFEELYGGTVSLEDFAGQPVLLAYFATF